MTYEQAINECKKNNKVKRKVWEYGIYIARSQNSEIFMDDGDERFRFVPIAEDISADDWQFA